MNKYQKKTTNEELSTKDVSTTDKTFLPCLVKDFLTFESSCHHLTSAYIELLSFSLVIHTFVGYLLLSNHPISPYFREILLLFRTQSAPYRLFQACTHALNIILLLSLLGAKLKYSTRIWFSAIRKIISLFGILSKISMILTSFLLYINLWENIGAMIISISLFIFKSLFIGNYTSNKQENYQISHQFSLIMRIGMIIQLFINCLIVHYGNLQIFCSSAAFFGLLTLIWHSKGGYGLFTHSASRKIHLLLCGAIISTSLLYLLLIKPRKDDAVFNLVEWAVSMIVVTFYLNQDQKKKRFTFCSPQTVIDQERSLNEYETNLRILLQQSDYSQVKQNLLLGILSLSVQTCPSPTCFLKKKKIFDPVIKRTFDPKDVFKEKDSVFRFFLKCIYSRALDHKKTKERMLDYVQFCISEMGDFSSHVFLLTELEKLPNLSFLQKIKIFKLKVLLKEQSQAFNKLIHGGKVQFDEVLTAQQTFELIMTDINRYCQRSIEIWKKNTQKEIDVFTLKEEISENFQLIPLINEKWNKLSKFLKIQKHWRYIYLNYALFLKNQNIRVKDSEDLVTSEDSQNQMCPLNKNKEHQQYFRDSLCFNTRATLVMCILEEELKIYKVSQHFEKLTNYPERQMKGEPLTRILPYEVRNHHATKVINWLENGRTTDDSYYFVKHTYFVNKFQKTVQSIVLFKLYADIASDSHILKFIALIKVNEPLKPILQNFPNTKKKSSQNAMHILQKSMMEGNREHLPLKSESNIFLKDQLLKPTKNISQISKIKIVMRLLTFVLIGLLLTVVISLKSDIKLVDNYAKAQMLFCHLYKDPVNLGKYYYSILSSGDFYAPFYRMKILENYKDLKQTMNTSLTIHTLFDHKLNQPIYYPPFKNNSVNLGLNYTNSDLFYLMLSSITTLSQNNFTSTSHDFIILNSYLIPSFSSMMNATKYNLHLQMHEKLLFFQKNQIIYIATFSFILLATAIYIFYQIYRYFSNMREAIDIIVQFSDTDISTIIKYWKTLGNHFRNLQKKIQKNEKGLSQISQNQENSIEKVEDEEMKNKEKPLQQFNNQNSVNLNQKHKHLFFSNKQSKNIYRNCLIMALLLCLFIPIVIVIQIVSYKKISNLIEFQNSGFFISKNFPVPTITAYSISNKFFFEKFPQTEVYEFSKYQDILMNIEVMLGKTYLPFTLLESQFYQKTQTYLFGNPCINNSNLLQKYYFSQRICQTLVNGAFTQGVISYMRIAYPSIRSYLKNQTSNIQLQEFSDYIRGLGLAGYLVQDILQTWLSEFSLMLNNFEEESWTLVLIVSFLLLLLHIVLFECFILSNLKADYEFMKTVFETYVPEHILTKEKIIKHRFYQSGILTVN